jgi:hypothetical protein
MDFSCGVVLVVRILLVSVASCPRGRILHALCYAAWLPCIDSLYDTNMDSVKKMYFFSG